MATQSLEELMGSLVAEHREKIVDRAIEKLSTRLAKLCFPSAEARLNELMNAKLSEIVELQSESILSTAFRETDCYGNIRHDSKPKTIVELILERAEKWMEEKVDSDGRSGNGWGSTKDRTRAMWMAQKAADSLIKEKLQPEIDKAKSELKKQLDGKLSAAFQEALKHCLK